MCDFAPNREAAMVTIATDQDGNPTVWCDPCIADLVQMLNDNGYPTVASCCGHGRRPSIISLLDGRAVMVLDEREQEQMIDVWPGINGEPKDRCGCLTSPETTCERGSTRHPTPDTEDVQAGWRPTNER